MGIGGSETLLSAISSKPMEIDFSKIYEYFSTDDDFVNVSVDFGLERMAIYSVIWYNVMDRLLSGEEGNFASDEYIIEETKKMLVIRNRSFIKAKLMPYWCLEGTPNKKKLATQIRSSKNLSIKEELLSLFLKADALKSSAHSETMKNINKFSYLKKRLSETLPHVINNKLLFVDEKKENITDIYNKIVTLVKNVRIFPENYFNLIEEYVIENKKEFKSIKIPSISEAEKVGSILTQIGFCKILFTTDSDALVLGARYVARKKLSSEYGGNDRTYLIHSYEKILQDEELTPNKLLLVGILMGNDFNTKAKGDGYKTIKEKISKPDFSLYEYNVNHCGTLNPDVCIAELGITREERDIVFEKVKELFFS